MFDIYSAMKESCLGGMSHTFTFMSHTFGCLLQGGNSKETKWKVAASGHRNSDSD